MNRAGPRGQRIQTLMNLSSFTHKGFSQVVIILHVITQSKGGTKHQITDTGESHLKIYRMAMDIASEMGDGGTICRDENTLSAKS